MKDSTNGCWLAVCLLGLLGAVSALQAEVPRGASGRANLDETQVLMPIDEKAVEQYTETVLGRYDLDLIIHNKTDIHFHDSIFACKRSDGRLVGAVGNVWAARQTRVWTVHPGACVVNVQGRLYYRDSSGKVRQARLEERQASPGKCWVKLAWKIVYRQGASKEELTIETLDDEIEVGSGTISPGS